MTNKQLLILGIAPLLALGACGGNTDSPGVDNGMETSMSTGNAMADDRAMMNDGAGNAMAAAAMTGQDFADTVAASDAYEIAAGKLAQAKATSAGLKAFGAEMVAAHTQSTDKLKAAAGKASPAIMPAPALTAEQQAHLQALQAATGTAFDTEYKAQQVAAHAQALAAVRGYATNGDVESLRGFAREAEGMIAKHYDAIRGM